MTRAHHLPVALAAVLAAVADFTADAENEYGDPVHATRWMRGRLGWWAPGMGGNWIGDDDVPTDAVLVLPAPTRT